KPFVTKDFSKALGISRVSFAPAELLYEMLGTKVGATTVFSMLLDRENKVQVVIDKDVLKEEWYGCTDGTTTCYMRVKTERILNDFLPYTKHEPKFIEV
ncbi:MAG TPA: YbaK/EbsC family protein, partial [Clostridiales bacterium]|nr:YbaK/EbsC family protein [Clostridiales bacterium]